MAMASLSTSAPVTAPRINEAMSESFLWGGAALFRRGLEIDGREAAAEHAADASPAARQVEPLEDVEQLAPRFLAGEIEQCGGGHVAGDPGEAVHVQDPHPASRALRAMRAAT